MTEKEEANLRVVYEKWSVERLAVAASEDRADYQPRAVEMMLVELERRGIDDAQLRVIVRARTPFPAPVSVEPPGTLLFPTKLNRKQYLLRWLALVAALIGGSLVLELVPAIQPTAFGLWLLLGLG